MRVKRKTKLHIATQKIIKLTIIHIISIEESLMIIVCLYTDESAELLKMHHYIKLAPEKGNS